MADHGKTLHPKIADLLARHPHAKGARLSAQIDADGGTATSVTLNMTASKATDRTRTSVSARLDAEGTTISATGDTAGASRSLELNARLQEKSAVAQVIAAAEAKDDDADTDTDTTASTS